MRRKETGSPYEYLCLISALSVLTVCSDSDSRFMPVYLGSNEGVLAKSI